jgi:hypothetical protein
VTALAPGTPDLLATPPGFTLGGVVSDYQYREPSVAVEERGVMAGLSAAYGFPFGRRARLRADLEYLQGRLRYRGSGILDGVPDTRLEPRLTFGWDCFPWARAGLSPYLGYGLRLTWNDLRGTTSTGARGYRRDATYRYLPLGCTARVAAGRGWVLAPTLEYDWLLGARVASMLGDANTSFTEAINHPGGGHGVRASVLAERGRVAFGPWVQSWSLGASETVPIGAGYTAQEPGNRTLETGLAVTWRF